MSVPTTPDNCKSLNHRRSLFLNTLVSGGTNRFSFLLSSTSIETPVWPLVPEAFTSTVSRPEREAGHFPLPRSELHILKPWRLVIVSNTFDAVHFRTTLQNHCNIEDWGTNEISTAILQNLCTCQTTRCVVLGFDGFMILALLCVSA
jgi:hypothetical protein